MTEVKSEDDRVIARRAAPRRRSIVRQISMPAEYDRVISAVAAGKGLSFSGAVRYLFDRYEFATGPAARAPAHGADHGPELRKQARVTRAIVIQLRRLAPRSFGQQLAALAEVAEALDLLAGQPRMGDEDDGGGGGGGGGV